MKTIALSTLLIVAFYCPLNLFGQLLSGSPGYAYNVEDNQLAQFMLLEQGDYRGLFYGAGQNDQKILDTIKRGFCVLEVNGFSKLVKVEPHLLIDELVRPYVDSSNQWQVIICKEKSISMNPPGSLTFSNRVIEAGDLIVVLNKSIKSPFQTVVEGSPAYILKKGTDADAQILAAFLSQPHHDFRESVCNKEILERRTKSDTIVFDFDQDRQEIKGTLGMTVNDVIKIATKGTRWEKWAESHSSDFCLVSKYTITQNVLLSLVVQSGDIVCAVGAEF